MRALNGFSFADFVSCQNPTLSSPRHQRSSRTASGRDGESESESDRDGDDNNVAYLVSYQLPLSPICSIITPSSREYGIMSTPLPPLSKKYTFMPLIYTMSKPPPTPRPPWQTGVVMDSYATVGAANQHLNPANDDNDDDVRLWSYRPRLSHISRRNTPFLSSVLISRRSPTPPPRTCNNIFSQ